MAEADRAEQSKQCRASIGPANDDLSNRKNLRHGTGPHGGRRRAAMPFGALELYPTGGRRWNKTAAGCCLETAACRYCKPNATKRVSPSALETSSTATFLPSVLSASMRLCKSAGVPTASYWTSTITSPGDNRLSGAEVPTLGSTAVTMTPLTLSRTLNFLRRSSDRLESSRPKVFCTTDFCSGASFFASAAAAAADFLPPSRRP